MARKNKVNNIQSKSLLTFQTENNEFATEKYSLNSNNNKKDEEMKVKILRGGTKPHLPYPFLSLHSTLSHIIFCYAPSKFYNIIIVVYLSQPSFLHFFQHRHTQPSRGHGNSNTSILQRLNLCRSSTFTTRNNSTSMAHTTTRGSRNTSNK